MSFIKRIAVLCLVLAVIPGMAAASDGGDQDHGHDSDGASGSDLSSSDSHESFDSGGNNADRDTNHSDNHENSGQNDRSDSHDISSEKSGGEMHDESSKEDHAGMSETRTGVLEEKDSHDISSEKSGRELHDESSKEDHAGMSETRTGDSEGTDTLSMDSGVSGTLSDNSDGVSGDTKGPPAQEKLLNQNTPAESGNRQVPLLPEQVPNGKVPFASTPALPATGLPIGSAANNSPGTGTPRNKARDENEPFWDPTDSALIMSPWMLLKFWCFLGFRRVLKKNVLENDERSVLYENIVTQPGVDLSQLTEKLSLNKETARYHLKMLAAHGKISGLIKQGIARYFPCREMISEFEKTVIHYLWIGTTKRILMLLIETPGITRQAIASELGIAGPSVTWQMQRLAEDGLIEMRTEGRFVRYFLTTGSFDAIESLRKADRRTAPMLF